MSSNNCLLKKVTGRVGMAVGTGRVDMAVTTGRVDMAVATGRVDMAVAARLLLCSEHNPLLYAQLDSTPLSI